MSKRRQKEKAAAFVEDEEVKPSKEECQVAKFLLGYLPEKEGKLHGMPVKIFIGEEAVAALQSEAYAKSKISKKVAISDTSSAVSCLCNLMAKQMFHRAERVLKRKRDKEDGDRPAIGATSRKKRTKEEEKALANGSPNNHDADEDTTGEGAGEKGDEKTGKDVAIRPKKKEKKNEKSN